MKKIVMALAMLCFLLAGAATTAFAHGVEITYNSTSAIQVTARYDTGEPISEGEVIIYAPNDPARPWATGKCDENGVFTFTPDLALQGTWSVQVRKAGHGGVVHIPVEGNAVQAGGTGFSTGQIVLMSACVIWGFAGTALFFSRRKS